MSKKMIGIIGVLLIISIVIICIFISRHDLTQKETGSFNKFGMVINGYNIDVNSKEAGHPSGKSYFNTSFDITDNEHNITTYTVDFIDLKLFSESSELNDDILGMEEIEINGKKFDYYLDDTNTKATLYYQIPDGNGQLIIEVTGIQTFDFEGNLRKEVYPVVNRKVLESKELAGILNLSVSKTKE